MYELHQISAMTVSGGSDIAADMAGAQRPWLDIRASDYSSLHLTLLFF